jgi:hypothetical protein
VVPTFTVRLPGLNANPEIETFAVIAAEVAVLTGRMGLSMGVDVEVGRTGFNVRVAVRVLVGVGVGRIGFSVRVAVLGSVEVEVGMSVGAAVKVSVGGRSVGVVEAVRVGGKVVAATARD